MHSFTRVYITKLTSSVFCVPQTTVQQNSKAIAFGEMQPLIVVYAFVFKPDSSENTFTNSPLGDLGIKDCNG